MKKIFLIGVIFLGACQKEIKEYTTEIREEEITARSNQNQIYHTCANGWADQTQGTEGIAASVNVEKLRLGGATIKSWWMGAYWYIVIDGVQHKYWVQWGYAVDRGGIFQAFYVYEIYPSYRYLPVTIININQDVPLKYGTRVRFEIKRSEGTYWSFLRDEQKVFDIDLGTANFNGVLQSCTESWGDDSFSPILHVDYFDIYRNGLWEHLPHGQIGSEYWNLVGTTKRPDFQSSEHEFGGRIEYPINYILW